MGELDWTATGSMMSGIGSVLTCIIAAVAAVFAWNQVQISKRLNAEDSYLAFHKMSFDNPEYAEPDFKNIRRNKLHFVKYHWFVIGMLMSIERIIIILPDDKEWRAAVTDDLSTHCDYICSEEFAPFIKNYSIPMQAFLTDFIRSGQGGSVLHA